MTVNLIIETRSSYRQITNNQNIYIFFILNWYIIIIIIIVIIIIC